DSVSVVSVMVKLGSDQIGGRRQRGRGWRPERLGGPARNASAVLGVGRVVVVEDALEGRLQRRELGVDVEPFSGSILVVDGLEGLAGLLVVGHPGLVA